MSLIVLEPGLFTTIQDRGRTGRRGLGVPLGGPADAFSCAIANFLSGNAADAPALEMTMLGPTLRAEADVLCAVFGAPFDMTVSGRPTTADRTLLLRAGQVLRVGGCPAGMRAYLAVGGGFDVPRILGCASSEEPVRRDRRLDPATRAFDPRGGGRRLAADFAWDREPRVLRCLPGDHLHLFDRGALFDRPWKVGTECDRMGIRLTGEALARPAVELLSEPICPGTVQITNQGQPVVLGVACQTIGGYPRAAHVIAADLDKLGRLRPGDEIVLRDVSRQEAARVLREKAEELAVWRRRLSAAVFA
jgi:antagonist of KipI